MHESMNIKFI